MSTTRFSSREREGLQQFLQLAALQRHLGQACVHRTLAGNNFAHQIACLARQSTCLSDCALASALLACKLFLDGADFATGPDPEAMRPGRSAQRLMQRSGGGVVLGFARRGLWRRCGGFDCTVSASMGCAAAGTLQVGGIIPAILSTQSLRPAVA